MKDLAIGILIAIIIVLLGRNDGGLVIKAYNSTIVDCVVRDKP